jgi:hypothetical protein
MASEIDNTINREWMKTCSVVLGEEIGELKQYSEWLSELTDGNLIRKSDVSGKDVAFSIKDYSEGSKWISLDEIDMSKRFEPLNIDDIKDIDSITEAIEERIYYCGNVLLGNCNNVLRSTNLSNASYVSDSALYTKVKYMAYSTLGRENSHCFGCHGPGGSEFLIRCSQTVNVKRSFELWASMNSSDCYYVYGLDGCSDCMFSFNLRNKRCCVGNLELGKDKYAKTRQKILGEIIDELKKTKNAPSLIDIVKKSRILKPEITSSQKLVGRHGRDENKSLIEDRFTRTSKMILGNGLQGLDGYGKWLSSHTHGMEREKSSLSGEEILLQQYGISMIMLPRDRLATMSEAKWIGENTSISSDEAEKISLENVHENIGKIVFMGVDMRSGMMDNLIECSFLADSNNCYNASMMIRSRYCAFGMWPKDSHDCFGFDSVLDSGFCIKCYHSDNLERCFEVDSCRSCSDLLFSHNCESTQDSMFCFNVKNLRHGIGNAVYDPQKYKKVKDSILEQVMNELEEKKELKWSIFNIGSSNHDFP